MMRYMAVKQEVSCKSLTQSRSALGLQIQSFGRADNLNVHSVCRRANHRVLHRSVPSCCSDVLKLRFTFGRTRPADGAAMRVVGVEHFTAAMDQAKLRRVAKIRSRDRGWRISKRI